MSTTPLAALTFHFNPNAVSPDCPFKIEIHDHNLVGIYNAPLVPTPAPMAIGEELKTVIHDTQTLPEPAPCTTLVRQQATDEEPAAKRVRTEPTAAAAAPAALPNVPQRISPLMATWTNANDTTKVLGSWLFPDRKNAIKLKISPHSANKGLFTAIIHNRNDNKISVFNNRRHCTENTISTRKNAVTFHYVLSYAETHTIEATHLRVARGPKVYKFKLVPRTFGSGWNIFRV